MERLVANRSMNWLNINNKLPDSQYGYRAGRSTDTLLSELTARITHGLKTPKNTPHERTGMVSIDLQTAFDTVVHWILMERFKILGIPPKFARWYWSFLRQRSNYVRVGDSRSQRYKFSSSVPQGSVSGPILWDIYISGLPDVVSAANAIHAIVPQQPNSNPFGQPLTVYEAYFADDLNWLCQHTDERLIIRTLQKVMKKIHQYLTHTLCLTLSQSKPLSFILFTSYSKNVSGKKLQNKHGKFCMAGSHCPWSKEISLLGVKLRSSFCSYPHLKSLVPRVNLRLNQLSWVAGQDWGMEPDQLRITYLQYILPVILYAAAAWYPKIGNKSLDDLRSLHHRAARTITRCYRVTDIPTLLLLANLHPLDYYLQTKTVIVAEKIRRFTTTRLSQIGLFDDPKRKFKAVKSWKEISNTLMQAAGLRPRKYQRNNRIPLAERDKTPVHHRTTWTDTSPIPPWLTNVCDRVSFESTPYSPKPTPAALLDKTIATNYKAACLQHSMNRFNKCHTIVDRWLCLS